MRKRGYESESDVQCPRHRFVPCSNFSPGSCLPLFRPVFALLVTATEDSLAVPRGSWVDGRVLRRKEAVFPLELSLAVSPGRYFPQGLKMQIVFAVPVDRQ